jgi:hypothetical protein
MMFSFLPWERLPAWLLGLILTLAGVFILFDAELYSWRQVQAVAMVLVGSWMVISILRKVLAVPDIGIQINRKMRSPKSTPDYAKYSEAELRQVLARIDRERFPDRVLAIETMLLSLQRSGYLK